MQKCGLTMVRTTPYEGPDVIEGAEHGEAEHGEAEHGLTKHGLTKPEWRARDR